jgi:hypothetical protein
MNMRVAWRYIDKATAAINVIGDYGNQRAIIDTPPEEIKASFDRPATPASSRLTGMPRSHNPHAAEERMADGIDQRDLLRDRYSEALEYMAWFEPAWKTLTDTERTVLSEFYASENLKSGACTRLQRVLNFGEAQIQRIRGKALSRLITLLFGR